MERTPAGTAVGVDDPYEFAGRCDHVTDDGSCRLAIEHPDRDPDFTRTRRREDYACPVADGSSAATWRDCPHYRSRASERACARCGLGERRRAHDDDRPLLERHHLSYPDGETSHEITIFLCRWCHARVHASWARIDDDVNPDPAAIAAFEGRRSRELEETSFRTGAERREE